MQVLASFWGELAVCFGYEPGVLDDGVENSSAADQFFAAAGFGLEDQAAPVNFDQLGKGDDRRADRRRRQRPDEWDLARV